MPFTDDLTRLQEIAARLEQERLPLETSLELFEEGMALATQCRTFLAEARQKVVLLSAENTDDLTGEPWNPAEEAKGS